MIGKVCVWILMIIIIIFMILFVYEILSGIFQNLVDFL